MKIFSVIFTILLSLAISAFFFILALIFLFLNARPVNPDHFATYPPTELVYEHVWSSSVFPGEKILKGEKVSGHFIAQTNRLGTVAIKFDTFNRVNNDQIIFRIKENEEKVWFYENTYNTDPIRQEVFWPFGFPLISDSKDKTYKFEIESLWGENEQAIAINPLQKFFITKYSYSKQWLLENKKEIPSFVLQKIISTFKRLNVQEKSLIGFLAFISLSLPFLITESVILIILFLSRFTKRPPFITKKLPRSNLLRFLRLVFVNFSLITLFLITKLLAFLLFTVRIISKIISKMFAKIPLLIIVSFFLLLLTTVACLFDNQVFVEDTNPRDLVYWHQWTTSPLIGQQILAGQKITGEFLAPQNRLSVISTRIYDFGRDNKDKVIFRIKEKNSTKWIYQNSYKTSPMRTNVIWPFGFPAIENSKNKTYEFEIESLQGTPDDGIAIAYWEKIYFSKYSHPLSWLINNKQEILPFVFNKIFLPFTRLNMVSWKYIFVFPLLPLLIYFLRLHKIGHFLLSLKSAEQKNIFSLNIKKSHDFFKESRSEQEIFLKTAVVLILMIITFFLFTFLIPVPNTEQFEWLVYEITPIMALAIFWGLGLFFKKRDSLKINKKIKFLLLITLGLFLSILYLKNLFPKQIAFFLPIACLPILPLVRKTFKKTHSLLKTLGVILNNQYFWVNFIGIFGAFSFFYETMLNNPNNRSIFLEYLLIISFLSYLILNYQVSLKWPLKKIGRLTAFIAKIILAVGGSFFLFMAIYREIFSRYVIALHTYYYVGPGLDILNHKSLLYDTPSQYGYLSMHFVAALQKIYGFTIDAFDIFNSFLYVIFTVIAGFIFYKLTKKISLTIILSSIYIGFLTFFSDYNSFLYPSSGPLRFGFGILMIFFLLYFPGWPSFVTGTVLASISVFWAAETTLYIVPAWLFTCLVIAWTKHGLSRAFLKESLLKIGAFLITTLLLFFIILIKEYRQGLGFPPFWNLLDYPLAYKNGFYAIFMPTYGNHYLVILIAIFGLGILFHLLSKKLYPKVLPALAFIVIHNIAIFSYYVSRSWYSLVINIFGFFLLELILIYKAIQETKGVNQQKLKAYFGLPIVIFLVLFIVKCYYLLPDEITMFKYNLSQLSVRKVEPKPLLTQIAQNYKIDTQNVVLLSAYDTLYLSEAGAKNLLPLNPNSMTFVLTNWREKYLNPQINNLSSGTIFIFDDSLIDWDPTSHAYLKEIRNMIEEKYELILLGEIKEKKVKVFKILGKRILP